MPAKVALGLVKAVPASERQGRRARHSATDWAKIIAAYRHSTLSVVEFCRRRELALSTFGYWRRRLASPTVEAPPAQRFLAVPLVPTIEHIEVEVDTLRVRLHGSAADRVVAAIVARIDGGGQP